MNYYIADLHFGHKNVMSYDNRPFKDIESHDKTLISNWNNTVGYEDDVYVLGDISWHNATETNKIFKKLNGNIHLIIGNHDGKLLKNRELRDRFCEICHYKEIDLVNGKGLILQHYPSPCFKNHYYGWFHLYGHVHNSWEWNMMEHLKMQMEELYDTRCNMYNCGAMMPYMNYTPHILDEIVAGYERTVGKM